MQRTRDEVGLYECSLVREPLSQSFRETSGSVMSAIYVETLIGGYLTARSASDVVFQARQELTRR